MSILNTRKSPNPIVPEEMVNDRVSDLFAFVNEIAETVRPANSPAEPISDFSDLLRSDLRRYLEDEIIPAVPSPLGGLIDETELRHELAKKALIRLKLSTLRQTAKDLGASAAGGQEELAEAVARSLGWDSEAVAQFILSHEEEPTSNHAHSVRLFPLDESCPEPSELESEVTKFMGRYIRVGVARWYVFTDLARTDDGVKIFGKYMAYNTGLDSTAGVVGIVPVQQVHEVEAHVAPIRKAVEVNDVSSGAAKAAVFAATSVLSQRTLDHIPHAGAGADRVRGKVHDASEFLLNILEHRIPQAGIDRINLTVARFKFDNRESEGRSDKPELKAVRFEGNHILDSAEACRLLVEDGRPLVNIAFRVYLSKGKDRRPEDSPESSFPVKIALESDHVQVTTGLGDDPVDSVRIHHLVQTAVWQEMSDGRSADALEDLIDRMTVRARSVEAPDKPSMLSRKRPPAGAV